jgi:hypothetical protein
MDTNEGMLKTSIRQYVQKRRHVKEIHTSAWTEKKACERNPYVSMETKEGVLRKCIRLYGHKRRYAKEIHTSAWTQKKVY